MCQVGGIEVRHQRVSTEKIKTELTKNIPSINTMKTNAAVPKRYSSKSER
jgi:hypothetical protein